MDEIEEDGICATILSDEGQGLDLLNKNYTSKITATIVIIYT